MSERRRHCWAPLERWDAAAGDRITGTCMLEAAHAGWHEWTADSEITLHFAEERGELPRLWPGTPGRSHADSG